MGVKREDLVGQRFLLPGVRFAVDAYVNFCRFRPWLEAVAACPPPQGWLRHGGVRGGGGVLLPEGLVALNPTGAEILGLCDGVRSVADVVAALEQRYGAPAGGVEPDVTAFLDGLAAKGLVTYGS